MNDDLVQRVIGSVQAVIAKAIEAAELRFNDRLLELGNQNLKLAAMIAELPKPERGEPGPKGDKGDAAEPPDLTDIERKVKVFLESMPRPVDGINGKDGKDANELAIALMLEDDIERKVALAFAALPPSKDGIDGQDGQDGQPGERGEAGRDALDLDVIPAINEARSYARGTWAAVGGSLWRASKSTTPLAETKGAMRDTGWQCMVAGVDAIDCRIDLERRCLLFDLTVGGIKKERSINLPLPLDRGVYKIGSNYLMADIVSHDGSAWIAQTTPATDLPGTSKQWRLFVMRGRNGKDGTRQELVEAGPVRLR